MKNVYTDSIVLIGPVGVGKSLIAQELSLATGLPVISSDRLRHLIGFWQIKNMDISKLDKNQQQEFGDSLKLWDVLLKAGISEKKLSNFYSKHGFSKELSQEIEKKYGPIGWHFYQKQFELELLRYITSKLKEPVILDLGAGMTISLDNDYQKVSQRMMSEDKNLYVACFNKKRSFSFKDIKKEIGKFQNVVYLQLPKDYKTKMDKASKDKLNDIFLSTKQYEELSKMTINVDELINGSEINKEKAKNIVSEIIKEKVKT